MTPHQQTWWPLLYPVPNLTLATPFEFKPDYARLLGVILERWTLIEEELTNSLGALLDGNYAAAEVILYGLNATSMRIEMVRAVARHLMPEMPEKSGFLWLLDKINDLQKQRNELIHGQYYADPDLEDGLYMRVIRPFNSKIVTERRVTIALLKDHVRTAHVRWVQLIIANAEDPTRYRRRSRLHHHRWPRGHF
jgi:hypothetical protein